MPIVKRNQTTKKPPESGASPTAVPAETPKLRYKPKPYSAPAVKKQFEKNMPRRTVDIEIQNRLIAAHTDGDSTVQKFNTQGSNFRNMMLDIAQHLKAGEGVEKTLANYDVSSSTFYLLLSNSDEFAELCGKERMRFKWDTRKLQVAQDLADGHSARDIELAHQVDGRTISRWLRIQEFAHYVDDLVMEAGLANRRLRIATMRRVAEKLLETVVNKLDRLEDHGKLDDESAKGLLSELREYTRSIAEEKRELVQITENTNTTTVAGVIGVAASPTEVREFLNSIKDDEARAEAENAIRSAGDELISRYGG